MLRASFFVLTFFSAALLLAQNLTIDTLKASYKTRGILDSLDVHSQPYALPFTLFGFTEFPNDQLVTEESQGLFLSPSSEKRIIFTALPHIGFGYTFGQQGTQLLTANYQQSISKLVVLNAEVFQNQSNGFQRNSAHKQLSYKFLMQILNSRIRNISSIEYSNRSANWSGGLISDSLLEVLPQDLISVNKDNAFSRHLRVKYANNSRYSFSRNTDLKFGAELNMDYSVFKRFYYEEGDLNNIYSLITIDSTETADSIYFNRINSSLGVFYESGKLKFSSHFCLSDWQSRTVGRQLDTTELSLDYYLEFKPKYCQLTSKGMYGLYGNFSSILIDNELYIGMNAARIRVYSLYSRLPPSPFIRDFRSNNLDYTLPLLSLQQNIKLGIDFNYRKSIFSAQLGGEYWHSKNAYFFDSTAWSMQFPQAISALKVNLNTNLNSRRFVVQIGYNFTSLPNEILYIPQHRISARLAVKTGLFKEGRLKTILGMDAHYLSAFKRLEYSPVMGTFNMSSLILQEILAGYYSLGAFANFSVNQFRFFVRFDNIPFLWIDKKTEIISRYYYPTTQFKIGITWDFWN